MLAIGAKLTRPTQERGIVMPKIKLNVTMDQDLVEYAKAYAAEQRTSVSEVFTQFILNLKRRNEDEPMRILLDDPEFSKSLLSAMEKIQSGRTAWSTYDEVFPK